MDKNHIAIKIARCVKTLVWRRHARTEAEDDDISESRLEDALQKGFKIVEYYPDDPYGESALVLTYIEKTPVHVVLSPRKDFCYLITVYLPDKEEWSENFERRRK